MDDKDLVGKVYYIAGTVDSMYQIIKKMDEKLDRKVDKSDCISIRDDVRENKCDIKENTDFRLTHSAQTKMTGGLTAFIVTILVNISLVAVKLFLGE